MISFIENPAKTTMIHILDQMETTTLQTTAIQATTGLGLEYFISPLTYELSKWKGVFQNCANVRLMS